MVLVKNTQSTSSDGRPEAKVENSGLLSGFNSSATYSRVSKDKCFRDPNPSDRSSGIIYQKQATRQELQDKAFNWLFGYAWKARWTSRSGNNPDDWDFMKCIYFTSRAHTDWQLQKEYTEKLLLSILVSWCFSPARSCARFSCCHYSRCIATWRIVQNCPKRKKIP